MKLLILVLFIISLFIGGLDEQTIPDQEGRRIAGRIERFALPTSDDFQLNRKARIRSKRSKTSPSRISNQSGASNQYGTRNPRPIQTSYVSEQKIKSYARKHGVNPTRFYNLIQKESGLKVYAKSPNGTYIGLAQWRPSDFHRQAKAWGLNYNIYNPDHHLDLTAKAISNDQEWRWGNTY